MKTEFVDRETEVDEMKCNQNILENFSKPKQNMFVCLFFGLLFPQQALYCSVGWRHTHEPRHLVLFTY